MKARDIATELDTAFAAARVNALMRRVLVGFGVFLLLTVAVIVTVSLLVHFLPTQGPTSAWKYAVLNKTLA